MKPQIFKVTVFFVVIAGLITTMGCFYTVSETEQAIITAFGKPVGEPITEAGLYFKLPFVRNVNKIDKQILEWDGVGVEMPTRDKLYISVDTFARWRIIEPLEYFRRLRDERSAQSRLDDILGSETRTAIANHDLIEVVRSTKDRVPLRDASIEELSQGAGTIGVLQPIKFGRMKIESEIQIAAKKKLAEFGIELMDIRFKRINYNQSVVDKIYERMVSERRQIASRFRSEGEGEAAKIMGTMERQLSIIESEAYEKVQVLRGEADAAVTAIYASAYGQTAESRELYRFTKTLETYSKIIGPESLMIFSTSGELLRFLNDSEGGVKK